jgi:AcrR family transcriptional regulator
MALRELELLLNFCQPGPRRMAAKSTRPAVRRPIQARAVRRRDQILDAAARVLDESGWDAFTTNAVAQAAGTAIGTVYQYFSSREEVLGGLLARHETRLQEAIDAAIARGGEDPLAVADAVVDAFASVWRSEPGYRTAWSASQTGGLIERTGDRWAKTFARRVAGLLQSFFPGSARANMVTARVAIHLVSGLLLAAMSGPRRQERAMIAETKRALRAYLVASLASA